MANTVRWFCNDSVLEWRHKDSKTSDKAIMRSMVSEFMAGDKPVCRGEYGDPAALETLGKDLFRCLPAAGGAVFSPEGKILVIRRLDRWDLPKGKVEKGETPEETAVREVMEECGLTAPPVIVAPLVDTYHIYPVKEEWTLKHTRWFAMKTASEVPLIPQAEEGIAEARWMPVSDIPHLCRETYASLREVFQKTLTFASKSKV